jgi:hypothetical protein
VHREQRTIANHTTEGLTFEIMRNWFTLLLLALLPVLGFTQHTYQIALLKYNGGGDWYANLETSLPNLIEFTNENLNTNINPEQAIVSAGDKSIFNYPFVHMTGHGNVVFSDQETQNLRKYMISGGFLHIDDNYGMDEFIRVQLKRIFPELEMIELPATHPIFHQKFDFKEGLPKVHEHDNSRPQAFGVYFEGRLVCLYTFESDLGDGCEDQRIHNDPTALREKALQMGSNMLQFIFMNDEQ